MADPFRKAYRELKPAEEMRLAHIKEKAQSLFSLFEHPLDGVNEPSHNAREFAIAKTKLEEAVMWAVKGITG